MVNKESMIKVLRYKAEHIKTKIKPEFFAEVADVLEQDCVSRAEIIDELNRLGRNAFKDDTDYNNFFAFVDSLPPVTPKPCEDAVSRAELKKWLDMNFSFGGASRKFELFDRLDKELPPVTPQPKAECSCDQIKWERDMAIAQLNELGYGLGEKPRTGHWILKRAFPTKIYNEYLNEYKCSECYRGIRCTKSQLVNYPYCHCGARMVEPHESENK